VNGVKVARIVADVNAKSADVWLAKVSADRRTKNKTKCAETGQAGAIEERANASRKMASSQ